MIAFVLALFVFCGASSAATESEGESIGGDAQWWVDFGDDNLNDLMTSGMANNYDLQAAWSRVEQARALSTQNLSVLLPTVGIDVSANTSPFDSLGFQFGGLPRDPTADNPDVYHTGSAMLSARVPVDVWGRGVLGHRASRFDLLAAKGDHSAQAIALSTRIAGAYFDVVAATEQLQIVETQVATNENLLELIELRYENSDSTALDVLQQRQQVAASQARPAQARVQLRNAQVQLGVLVGNIEENTAASLVLPVLPGPPPTGVSAGSIENRPDLRAAVHRLDAAHRRRLSAFRALLPTLQITGQAGYQANYFTEFDSQSTWGVGYAVSVPMFQGGRGHAALQQARAVEDGAAHAYSQLVLQAVGEVDIALTTEAEQRSQLLAIQKQVDAARLAYDESRSQYASGLTSYLSVLVALNTLQQAELSELSARRQLLNARVQLYDALGGNWPPLPEEHQP